LIILGINAYHGDSSACIIVDGKLVAAIEEERFTRIKHWAGLPVQSIKYCLNEAGAVIEAIDHIALNRNPKANLVRKAAFTFLKRPSLGLVTDRLKNAARVGDIKRMIGHELGIRSESIKAQIHYIEHHLAHMASAFYVSPFENASVVSVDGFGDFVGTMWGIGIGHKLEARERIFFPDSLGLYYLSLTQFLGFPRYGDEYKVMGLSAFGKPSKIDQMRDIVQLNPNGKFRLNLKYFNHYTNGSTMTWEKGEPEIDSMYSQEMGKSLGPARNNDEPITEKHENIAASLQAMYEEAFFHLLNYVYDQTKTPVLCLAGGCAMNSVANGKIFNKTLFQGVYIQSAAGDAGGALGAAYYVWHQIFNKRRDFVMEHSYWGPFYDESQIKAAIQSKKDALGKTGCVVEKIEHENDLCKKTAKEISSGKVVGWFQGRMEWGPRALGNRSIVADPRRSEMKDILNARIKRRESFRPFAPSIHIEALSEFFETSYPDPFMLKVYSIKPGKRGLIPAVTHVDGTARLQTVSRKDNALFWMLIDEFRKITGIPILLNTSFNENEPIVCRPEEALDCFLRTKMDVLVLNNFLISRFNE
jgi:carbamoyltransferase